MGVTCRGICLQFKHTSLQNKEKYSSGLKRCTECAVFMNIEDIIDGLKASINKNFFCEIFNLGNNRCENLMDMIALIEQSLGKKAEMNLIDMQPGDVKKTFADNEYSRKKLGYEPTTSIAEGIPKFISWYKDYIGYQ